MSPFQLVLQSCACEPANFTQQQMYDHSLCKQAHLRDISGSVSQFQITAIK